MTDFTTHEQQEIDRPNAEGKQPVVFLHGLWLPASSWDRLRALFEEQGYTTLAPAGPMTRRPSYRRLTTQRSLPTRA